MSETPSSGRDNCPTFMSGQTSGLPTKILTGPGSPGTGLTVAYGTQGVCPHPRHMIIQNPKS